VYNLTSPPGILSSKKEANTHSHVWGRCVLSATFPSGFFLHHPFHLSRKLFHSPSRTLHHSYNQSSMHTHTALIAIRRIRFHSSCSVSFYSLSHRDVSFPANNNTYISFLTRTCSINIFPVFSRLFRLCFRFFFLLYFIPSIFDHNAFCCIGNHTTSMHSPPRFSISLSRPTCPFFLLICGVCRLSYSRL